MTYATNRQGKQIRYYFSLFRIIMLGKMASKFPAVMFSVPLLNIKFDALLRIEFITWVKLYVADLSWFQSTNGKNFFFSHFRWREREIWLEKSH